MIKVGDLVEVVRIGIIGVAESVVYSPIYNSNMVEVRMKDSPYTIGIVNEEDLIRI